MPVKERMSVYRPFSSRCEQGNGHHEHTVQITLAGLGDAAAALVLVVLKDANLLKGLHGLAVDGAGGVDVVGGAGAAVLGGTVDLSETANTNGLAHVDVAGDGGGTDVEPVNVLGRHLLGGASLDGVDPTWRTRHVSIGSGTGAVKRRETEVGTYRGWAACPDASRKQRMH